MDKYVVELIGTYFLVLAVGLAAGAGLAGEFAPFAVGLVLIALIYAGGHVSAAHYNPAVTLAFWIRGRLRRSDIFGYLAGQFIGAFLAALCVDRLAVLRVPAPSELDWGAIVLAEVIFTFALVWVILNVATSRGTDGNGFYGLAIGSLVIGGAYTVGPISGAIFNPAVAVGNCLMGLAPWGVVWIYFASTFVGAALAAFAFKAVVRE